MDPEHTFIRVQERLSQMVTLRVRAALEYFYLFTAITLFCTLVVMHATYVQQPGCSNELSGVQTSDAQLIYIKIAGVRLLIQNESESNLVYISDGHSTIDKFTEPDAHGDDLNFFAVNYWFNWICSSARRGKLNFDFWKDYDGLFGEQSETTDRKTSTLFGSDGKVDTEEPYETFPMFSKQSFKAIISQFSRKWHRRLSFIRKLGTHVLRSIWVFI